MPTPPSPAAPPPDDPRHYYRKRQAGAAREAGALEARLLGLSRLRVGAFLVGAGPLLLLETMDRTRWPLLLTIAGAGGLAFIGLVIWHRRLRREVERVRLIEQVAREGEARLDRRWADLPPPPLDQAPPDHASAADLDLVGRASMAHLVGRTTTSPGRQELHRLLLDPLRGTGRPLEELLARQVAVRTLAPERQFRETFECMARSVEGEESTRRTEAFVRWASAPRLAPELRNSIWFARVLAVYTPVTSAGWLFGWGVPGIFPIVGLVAAFWLRRRTSARIHARFEAAEAGTGVIRRWSLLLSHVGTLPVGAQSGDHSSSSLPVDADPDASPLLASLGRAVRSPEPGAPVALRALLRVLDWGAVRFSAFAYYPLVGLFAWDLHVLGWLERWQERHGAAVEGWIRAMGEAEALVALAGLAHDHPAWAFPTFDSPPGEGIRAEALGHPLLPQDRCVRNDVELPGPGKLLLVTGSNMAGKTTLLRAVGTNQILALAGAPVSADSFRTRVLIPWTTMSVRDSLEEGVSFFLAELHRLRRVVGAAEDGPILYLLDEILQGTNSAERRTAARIVLDRLLDTASIGAVTTHDLTLADTEALRQRSVNVHFREDVETVDGHRTLTFDYRIRPGPATSRNALLLLEMVGLGSAKPGQVDTAIREVPRSPEDPSPASPG